VTWPDILLPALRRKSWRRVEPVKGRVEVRGGGHESPRFFSVRVFVWLGYFHATGLALGDDDDTVMEEAIEQG
jgi:hypothetical protein